jgi:NAD(P)-dependent dehydrogenase (short-subunit alcohol dehydrogenase family)
MKLSGKKAVITGAGGGLGSAMALELAPHDVNGGQFMD